MDTTNSMIQWSPGVSLEAIEKQVIIKAFAHYGRNKTQTAIGLGISIRTLDHKLERYAEEGMTDEQRIEREQLREASFIARARGPQRSADGTISAAALEEYNTVINPPIEKPGSGIQPVHEDDHAEAANGSGAETSSGPQSESDLSSTSGQDIQPASEVASQHQMPVRQRHQVQAMSQRQAGQAGKSRHR